MSKPSILFVSPVADLKGGAERVLLDMIANPAIRPLLAVPGEGEISNFARMRDMPVQFYDLGAVERVHRPITAASLASVATGALAAAKQIAQTAKEAGAAAVHTNGMKVHVIGALARRLHGTRTIAHLHDIAYTRLERAVWRGIGAGVSRTLVVSPPCWPGAPSARVGVVMNGSVRPPATESRTLAGLPVLGFVGRFHPFKGLHHLLDWFEALPPGLAGPLVVRGRAAEESEDYWAIQRARLDALGPRCRFEGWKGPGSDPFEGIDVLVVPSVTPDPSPLVVMEGMLSAIPIIGYNAGGIAAMMGDTGRLTTGQDSFTAAVRSLADPATYARESAAALARARKLFGVEDFWSRLNAQYRLAGIEMSDDH